MVFYRIYHINWRERRERQRKTTTKEVIYGNEIFLNCSHTRIVLTNGPVHFITTQRRTHKAKSCLIWTSQQVRVESVVVESQPVDEINYLRVICRYSYVAVGVLLAFTQNLKARLPITSQGLNS